MSKILNVLLSAVNLALFSIGAYFMFTRGIGKNGGWTPVELVTIMLTALGVMVAVLTLFIAILAVWGFSRLSDEARDKAEKVAKIVAEQETRHYLGSKLPTMVEDEIERRIGSNQGYGAGAAGGDGNASGA